MNTNRFLVIGLLVIGLAFPAALASQTAASADPQAQPQNKPPSTAAAPPQTPPETAAPGVKTVFPIFSYDQENRRDPFKDLFGGKEVREKRPATGGIADLGIDDIVLMGIVRIKGKYEAIAAFSDGFPVTLREGQVLADGFVLAIEADRIIYRKTSERGFPLAKPKDIIKEITPEERAHD